MSLEQEIRNVAKALKVPQGVIEKDFALGYILAGLVRTPSLNETLIFKGGTALKKCYFGEYRFSEDLDFSTSKAPRMEEMEAALQQSLKESEILLNELGPFSLDLARYTEKQPHPKDQEAFKIGVRFPWQRNVNCRIKIEISHHEPVILEPVARPLIHSYSTALPGEVRCYQLDEIVAEKMRTLLQSHQKLIANSWHRPRARDYYDLWHIFNKFGTYLSPAVLPDLLSKKARHVEVSYQSVADFFTTELKVEALEHWQATLGTFVEDLPPCQEVLDTLQGLVPKYFPNLA
jgi:predicted nucleotidyltransferase component of viral defense system